MKSLPIQQQHPLKDLTLLNNEDHIAASIINGSCALVSDGSYFASTNQAAAAFVIGNEAAHRRIIGRCHVVGPMSSFSAYRSELAGLHGGLIFVQTICRIYNIASGRITLSCDNKGALEKIVNKSVRLQDQHFDYVSVIINTINNLPIHITYIHVDGHKDKLVAHEDLSMLESMNVSADNHARTKASINPSATFRTNAEILNENKPIVIYDEFGTKLRIHSNLDKHLYAHITTPTSKAYWSKKMRIPNNATHEINWDSLGQAFSKLPSTKQKEVIKWNSGFCGTNLSLFRRQQSISAAYPGCNHPQETTDHTLQCQTSGATSEWNKAMEHLEKWMLEKTHSTRNCNGDNKWAQLMVK